MRFYLMAVLSVFALACGASAAHASDGHFYKLPYRAQNEWVAQQDNAGLNDLSDFARSHKITVFEFRMPAAADRKLYLNRLVIIRNILDQRLKTKVTLVQIPGDADGNTILMRPGSEDDLKN